MNESENGMSTGIAFLLTSGVSLSFVLGGMMLYNGFLLSFARPIVLVILLSTASFIFICTGLQELVPRSHSAFVAGLMSNEEWNDSKTQGLSQLFAILCIVGGICVLYIIDVVTIELLKLATKYTGNRQIRQQSTMTSWRSSDWDMIDIEEGISSRPGIQFDPMCRSNRPDPAIPELAEIEAPNSFFFKGSRATFFSAIPVIIQHTPEGVALFICCKLSWHLGIAVAIGVVLHSIPDGSVFASSIFLASGKRDLSVLWCFLSSVGTLVGALLAWSVLASSDHPVLRGICAGIAAGILVAIGVKEVLPTTHNYAVRNSHGTVSGIVLGMVLMAVSKCIVQ